MKENLDFWEGKWWEDYRMFQEYQKRGEYAEGEKVKNTLMIRNRYAQIGEVASFLGYNTGSMGIDTSLNTAYVRVELKKNGRIYNGAAVFEAGHLKTLLKAKKSGVDVPLSYAVNGQPLSRGTETIYPIYLGSFKS